MVTDKRKIEEDEKLIPGKIIQNDYHIFISHASSNDETSTGVKQLQGEHEYVLMIAKKLGTDPFNYRVFLDLLEKPFPDQSTIVLAYKNSKFGLFICSPRFNARYGENSGYVLRKEVTHFQSLESEGIKCIIPVILGTDKLKFTKESPFESLDFRVDGRYDDLLKNSFNYDLVIEEICLDIHKFIQSSRPNS